MVILYIESMSNHAFKNLIFKEGAIMKKLATIILSICAMIFAVSCANSLDADASQSGSVNPADLIPEDEAKTGQAAVEAFVNRYAGVYYSEGEHTYNEGMVGNIVKANGLKVDYKFRNGQVYTLSHVNEANELFVEPVEAVSPISKKLQLRHKDKGEVLVLNMTEEGLESYVSYILEKVSDEVLIQNEGVGGFLEELAPYKGTYNSIAQDNKIENYIAIDGEGNVYFHDANVTVAGGRVGITEGEGLTILESYQNVMRKIIFKFDQGVYRRFSIDGEHRDYTYIGVCEVSKDFIEDRFDDALYQTEDHWVKGVGEGIYFSPTEIGGITIKLNEPTQKDGGIEHVTLEGAVCIGGEIGDRWTQGKDTAKYDQVGHISVLIGNQLHVMGRYNAVFTFSDDWKTATYEGKTLNLKRGEVKNVTPATRKVKRITKRF